MGAESELLGKSLSRMTVIFMGTCARNKRKLYSMESSMTHFKCFRICDAFYCIYFDLCRCNSIKISKRIDVPCGFRNYYIIKNTMKTKDYNISRYVKYYNRLSFKHLQLNYLFEY